MLRFYQLLTMGEEVDVAEALRNASAASKARPRRSSSGVAW